MKSLLSPLEVLHLIQSTVGDQRVSIELVYGFDPLPVSSSDDKSFGFQIIKKTILDSFATVTVAPGTTSMEKWNTPRLFAISLSDDFTCRHLYWQHRQSTL